jgi:glutaminyl-tRNA synthetase
MAVLRPLRVVLENWPEDRVEDLEAVNNPEDPAAGTRTVPFGRVLWVERDDFREEPPPKFFRLSPGREVRLRYAYIIKCVGVVKDAAGEVTELRCTVDLDTRSGGPASNRKVKATLHWVSAAHAVPAEVRMYDRLFTVEEPDRGGDFTQHLNPASLEVIADARIEPSVADAAPGARFQFERQGYFAVDPDSRPGALVFNRTVSLRDTWAKIEQAEAGAPPPPRSSPRRA